MKFSEILSTVRGYMQLDMFAAEKYPNVPGARNTKTSRDAAQAMKDRAPTIRSRVLDLMRSGCELTPDEAADRLGLSLLAIRPRFSELSRLGKIVETGSTRVNSVSGHKANVYRISGRSD